MTMTRKPGDPTACKKCGEPISHRGASVGWVHDGTPGWLEWGYAGHSADPGVWCPKCHVWEGTHEETPWGFWSRHAACGWEFYYSLGD